MKHPASHFFQHTPETLSAWCSERGMKPFRSRQILDWVYRRSVADPGVMTDLSQRDRETLAAEMVFLSGVTLADQLASDGTRKLLVQWDDARAADEEKQEGFSLLTPGNDPTRQTECVMIPAVSSGAEPRPRRTACISSQVGCPVGCRFCASGLGGLDGNLSAGRIVEQVWRLDKAVRDASAVELDKGITNVVFMGMGEPLSNFASVLHAVRTLAAPWGMGLSARRITISTVGMPRAIERLAEQLELPVTLALSLHAPNDDLRRELIPWAEHSTIPELLAACSKWFEKTGREVTLEYILLGSVNDQPTHAHELSRVAKTLRANVNLIRYNEVVGLPFSRPKTADVRRFQEILKEKGVNAHIRASRGRDIAAACGQLRHEKAGA